MKIKLLLFFFLTGFLIRAQTIYLKTGKNYTNYRFENLNGSSTNLFFSDSGNSYAIGITTPFPNKKFNRKGKTSPIIYDLGLTLNSYNSMLGIQGVSFSWNTDFISLTNSFSYKFFISKHFNFDLKAGIGVGGLIHGRESANGVLYDLKRAEDFKGFLFSGSYGIQFCFNATDNIGVSLGFEKLQSLNTSTVYPNNFLMDSKQFLLGVHFKILNKFSN